MQPLLFDVSANPWFFAHRTRLFVSHIACATISGVREVQALLDQTTHLAGLLGTA